MKPRRMTVFAAAAFIALAFSAASARAGGVDPGEEPPGALHVLTYYDATTTSTCLGNPVTPLCAVETLEACFAREIPELCGAVEYPIPAWRSPITERRRQESLRYKVAEVKTLTVADIPPHRRKPEGGAWRAGDVRVVLRLQHCSPSSPPPSYCTRWVETPRTHIVRGRGGRWVYIDLLTPRIER